MANVKDSLMGEDNDRPIEGTEAPSLQRRRDDEEEEEEDGGMVEEEAESTGERDQGGGGGGRSGLLVGVGGDTHELRTAIVHVDMDCFYAAGKDEDGRRRRSWCRMGSK